MKRTMQLTLVSLLAFFMTLGTALPAFASDGSNADTDVINEKLGVPIVVYGGSLTADQKEQVRQQLDIKDPANTKEYTVTGQDIQKYINGDPSSRMFSSAKITRQDKGKGININIVTPDNITEVTSEMYANAMLTAGVEDANVDVSSPVKVTGHSALTGIYKAYDAAGADLNKDRMELANEELDVTTDLAKKDGMNSEKATQLMTDIKKEIADKKPATREDVEQIVNDQVNKLEISLSDKDRQLLIDLFDKMRNLNIDFSKVKTQLNDLTGKLKDKMDELGIDQGFWEKVVAFFKSFFQAIVDFFKGLFG
ncbi:DUF1002 domain-containing protein [Aciduricibacillus chroicocephali]|uniref:DUF1002 domain-containing protein n=1 Tax=Aciduricibacillus chroicocephali TaxID=3054939 RepID=A0ABY9KXJ5_9BACI|nr:DUF1002 domain-containing protein [Bacillaceae bacterium 44XB]